MCTHPSLTILKLKPLLFKEGQEICLDGILDQVVSSVESILLKAKSEKYVSVSQATLC